MLCLPKSSANNVRTGIHTRRLGGEGLILQLLRCVLDGKGPWKQHRMVKKNNKKNKKKNKSHKEGPSVSEGAGAGESRETPDDSPLMWFAGNDRCWGETRTSSLMHGNIRQRGPYLVFERALTFTHSHTTFSP